MFEKVLAGFCFLFYISADLIFAMAVKKKTIINFRDDLE
jgi:hypothetical protein